MKADVRRCAVYLYCHKRLVCSRDTPLRCMNRQTDICHSQLNFSDNRIPVGVGFSAFIQTGPGASVQWVPGLFPRG
jgi:hypothetical protein